MAREAVKVLANAAQGRREGLGDNEEVKVP